MTDDPAFDTHFQLAEQACAAPGADALKVPIGFLNDLSQATTQDEVLGTYSLWGRQIVAADRCSIALEGPAGQLTVTAMNGTRGIEPDSQYAIGTTLLGAVYHSGRPAFVVNPENVPSQGVQTLADLGYQCVICIPLSAKSACLGVLSASFFTKPDQPGSVITALQAIGKCLAMQLQIIEQVDALSHLALTDALTGAGNRRFLYERAGQIWDQWTNQQQPFCYLAIDLDHFKQINDTYGHDVGDAVLTGFVQRVRGRLRSDDILVRTGGEEFGLLMPDTTLGAAGPRAIRLCHAMRDSPFAVANLQLQITASFGLTGVLPEDGGFETVMKRADRALYAAKEGGRDQIVAIDDADLAA